MWEHTSYSRQANWWEDCDAKQSSYTSDGTDKRELLGERADGLPSKWVDSPLSIQPICLTKAQRWRYLQKSQISCTRDQINT